MKPESKESQCCNYYHVSGNRLIKIQVSVFARPHTYDHTSLVVFSCFVLYRYRSSVLDRVDTERKQVEIAVHR